MHCPTCGSPLVLVLALGHDGEPDAAADPLAPVVRRLEAERYAEPVHERGHDGGQRP